LLGELVTSSISVRVIDDVLAPLTALPEVVRETTIRTLSTYLDLQGSRARAATALHLHPNGVGHRINKAIDLLGVDVNDPEIRLTVQLACRVWLLSRGLDQIARASGGVGAEHPSR
jgi:DNA-binding PucR family transcriptional regulator